MSWQFNRDAEHNVNTRPANAPIPSGDKPTRRFRCVAIALGLMLALGGCSGDSDDNVSTNTGSTTTTASAITVPCPQVCPTCGKACWLQAAVTPHQCPNNHYWTLGPPDNRGPR